MRIDELTRRRSEKLPPLKAQVLRYLEQHPDEVFGYRDEQLARELGAKPSALGFTLWSLHERGLIEKETLDGKVYFGTSEAIAKLRAERRRDEWGVLLDEIDEFSRRMFDKYGFIDLKDLLEETREGR
jgi:hypothetical protein